VTPEQRQAWLNERRTGIGGSDAAAACGLSKWKTPLELYLDKRGELETNENEPMLWGHLLEPVIRQEYSNRTGRTVSVPEGIIRHPTVQFALMTPDGIADGSRVLQVKTARTAEGWGEPGTGDIPQEYILQTQHEMFVTQLPVADVAVLIGGSDFRLYVVEADADLQTMLIEQERQFWACVQANQPPAPMNREDVKRRWCIGTARQAEASPDEIGKAMVLRQWKELAKQLDDRIDGLAADLQSYMGDASELVDESGDVLATWKNIKAAPRFDMELFKAEQPEVFRQYLREAGPQRRFLLKPQKGKSLCQPQLPALPPMETAMAPSS
jgi:putative phage-type endonuclease